MENREERSPEKRKAAVHRTETTREYGYAFATEDMIRRAGTITGMIGASRREATKDGAGEVLYDLLAMGPETFVWAGDILQESAMILVGKALGRVERVHGRETDTETVEGVEITIELPGREGEKTAEAIGEHLRSYLTYALVGEWLAIKKPDEAQLWMEKATSYAEEILSMIKRCGKAERRYRLY